MSCHGHAVSCELLFHVRGGGQYRAYVMDSVNSIIKIAINKILRKIWHLPRHSHTSIVLCVAKILYIHEIIFKRFTNFFQRCTNSDIPLVNCVFQDSSYYFVYTSTGYNHMYGNFHLKQFNDNDLNLLDFIAKFLVIIHLMKPSYLIYQLHNYCVILLC